MGLKSLLANEARLKTKCLPKFVKSDLSPKDEPAEFKKNPTKKAKNSQLNPKIS